MPRKTVDLKLDLITKDIFQNFELKQFDSTTIRANILEDGKPYDLTDCQVILYVGINNEAYRQPTGITTTGSTIIADVDTNLLANTGKALGEFEITDQNGTISTATFRFTVGDKIGDGATIPGAIEGFYERYEKLLAKAKADFAETIDNCNTAVTTKLTQLQVDYNETKAEIIDGISNDYNSLKRIIIEENQAADLQNQINETNTQLEHNTNYLNEKLNPNFINKPVLVFIDDDCKLGFYDKLKPVCDEKGVKISLALSTRWIGGNGMITLNQIKELNDDGYDILPHGHVGTKLSELTDTEIEEELDTCIKYFKDNKIGNENILVYSNGITNTDTRVKGIVRNKFMYAVNNAGTYNTTPIDSFAIQRSDFAYVNIDGLKGRLNSTKNVNGIMVVMMHSWLADGDENSTNNTCSVEKFRQLIDYAKSQDIPIMTMSEALKYKGNVLSLNDYTSSNNFYLGNDGNVKIKTGVEFINSSSFDFSTPIDNYNINTITFVQVPNNKDTVTNQGGIMEVYRHNKYYSYALFHPSRDNRIYKRVWDDYTNSWKSWVKIDSLVVSTTANNVMDNPISSYPTNTESIIPIQTANDNFLNIGGVMRVFRSSLSNYSYATYTPYTKTDLYMRKWNGSSSAWGTWAKVNSV